MIEEDFEYDGLSEHLKILDMSAKEYEKEENIIKNIFPNGYENIELPFFIIAHKCDKCNARTLFIDRVCKNQTGKECLTFCSCLKCNAKYVISRKNNQIGCLQI